ncbi:MFS transporter [Patescibacteria group bacterium]|nr:MFS transporter [Patescibacteria group bacterium]MBU1890798.1 MFS transporter [Patescibacteria group bacterium]
MFDQHNYNLPHYFARRLTRPVKELYLSVAIMDLATASVLIFEPIYLYTLGYSVKQIVLFFLGLYGIYFIIMPLGAKYANSRGYEKSIIVSTIFLILYYLSLFALPWFHWLIFVAPIICAWQKTFYWPGYHADFASFSDEREQSRQIGNLRVINNIVYVLGPLAGGLIITLASFEILFVVVILLIVISNFPLLITKEKVTPRSFSYKGAYKRLAKKHHRRKLLAYIGFGEELVVMIIWPIFIYLIVDSFFTIGAIIALATLVTTFVTLYVGRVCDKKHKHPVIKLGTVLYSLTWWLRPFAGTISHVFLIDTLSRISKNMIYVPLTAITYFRARRYNIMSGVLFFEMALVVGKLLTLVSVFIVISYFGVSVGFVFAFVLAGFLSLLYNFLE